jgi:hypothetical protein
MYSNFTTSRVLAAVLAVNASFPRCNGSNSHVLWHQARQARTALDADHRAVSTSLLVVALALWRIVSG